MPNGSVAALFFTEKLMDTKKLKKSYKKIKKKEKEKRRTNKLNRMATSLDFNELDKHGKGMWTYDPSSQTRKNLLKILKRSSKNKQRKALVVKIGEELEKIYIEYRRLLLVYMNKPPIYDIKIDESKRFQVAAIECLEKDITPKQLIEYWDENAGNFAKASIPSIIFITSLRNIETAATFVLSERHKRTKNKKEKSEDDWVASRNSFSDLSKLDPRIRKGLKKAKVQGSDRISDLKLLSSQLLARDISNGFNVYVEEKMKPIVYWIVKNIYEKKK